MEHWANDVIFLMPNWKWVGFAIAITAGFLIRSLLKQFFSYLKNTSKIRNKAHGFVLYFIKTDIQGPLAWIITCLFWLASLDSLDMIEGLDKYSKILVQLWLSLHVIRVAYKAADAVGHVLKDITSKTENTLDDELAPLATKTLKVFVIIFGFLIVLQNFGVNVMALLAGLGIGGLAIAFAAQDTVANLFGSITLILDRPFQVGDWVKVAGTEGFIEEIGFRSTRIRTMYKSVITIPNSVMAKEQIDNMGARPMNRIRHVIGVTYDTTEEQMSQFIDKIRYSLLQHAEVDKDTVAVRFNALGDFSLQVLVNFFVKVPDVGREMEIQQDVLFEIMRIAKDLNIEFAFPTATHIIQQAGSSLPQLPASPQQLTQSQSPQKQ